MQLSKVRLAGPRAHSKRIPPPKAALRKTR